MPPKPTGADGGPGRIAILLPNLAGGGVERVRLLLAEQFLAKGYEVDLVLMERRGELLADVPPKCRVIDLHAPRLRLVPWRLRKYLQANRPDALLAAMWPLSGLAGLALRMTGVPTRLIVSEHNDLREVPAIKSIERKLLKLFGPWFYGRASKIVAVSEGVRDSLGQVARLPKERIEVIYNPIRPSGGDSLDAGDEDLLRWWEQAGIKLIAVGSLKPQKDYPTLLKSVALLRRSADVRLVVLGEGIERNRLEQLAESEGLVDVVRFLGFRASPQTFLRRADVFVLSSRWEGLGNVITEALSCGCRVVATDCPSGPSELLAGGRYGRLVPVGDPQGLASAITAAATAQHDPRPGIAWAARFTPAAAADAYLKLLFSGRGNDREA